MGDLTWTQRRKLQRIAARLRGDPSRPVRVDGVVSYRLTTADLGGGLRVTAQVIDGSEGIEESIGVSRTRGAALDAEVEEIAWAIALEVFPGGSELQQAPTPHCMVIWRYRPQAEVEHG